jgi:ABC-type multidrug transport system fused ATPase/permease subunit
VLVDQGQMIEHGNHNSLLAAAGCYAHLVNSQLGIHERPRTHQDSI